MADKKGILYNEAAKAYFYGDCVSSIEPYGGGHINAAFLADGLLDEVSILVGAGIDGRGGMAAVFDGLPMDRPVTPLKLTSVQQYGTGAVWLRYHTENKSVIARKGAALT